MSFMQDMDFSQQAVILGEEDIAAEIPPPEIIPIPVESAKKSKKQPVKGYAYFFREPKMI